MEKALKMICQSVCAPSIRTGPMTVLQGKLEISGSLWPHAVPTYCKCSVSVSSATGTALCMKNDSTPLIDDHTEERAGEDPAC